MEQIMAWVGENQDLILSYVIKFIVALLILLVGKMVANSVAKLLGKGMTRRGVDGAVIRGSKLEGPGNRDEAFGP